MSNGNCFGGKMKVLTVLMGLVLPLTAIDASLVAQVDQQGAAMKPGFEQILKSHNGRYSKHGWNHYGPGYFDLDSETGVLTSHGGMGLFWYSVKEYGDFVLEL